MKILLTGAFGNLGTSCIIELSNKNYEIRCFDMKSKMTETRYKIYKKNYNFETFWGNILDPLSIAEAMKDVDTIIHTAAIIPPLSDINPDLAKKVNVEGTKNLILEAEKQGVKQFIFSSSVSVHGVHYPSLPPVKTTDPLKPHDTYNTTKVECEVLLKNSKLKWTIVRFGAILPIENRGQPQAKLDDYTIEMLFGIPLDQKIEIIHSHDAALALVNAVNNEKAFNQVFFGGGGPKCQLYQRDAIFDMMKLMGIGKMPENVFKKPVSDSNEDGWFYTHWMDTSKSQEVLQFQRKTFDDYKKDVRGPPFIQKILFIFIGPIIKRSLIKKSPYKH
jgi:nucleoside-diphosphate-sugar epimerase